MGAGKLFAAAAALITTASAASGQPPSTDAPDLSNLSLEQLSNLEISSVSKRPEPLSDAPAAIYVITHDDIMRSGATSIPEILRLAPNLQVAEISATSYAITARGFNGVAADKLLVLIDGRSVYAPYFSGVFWDVQDVPPETIERIEVISGPGATLWGANAVNGVINIITRKSSDTAGGVLNVGGGNLGANASVQYGGDLGNNLSYRAYIEGHYGFEDTTSTGIGARDGVYKPQGGFRFDWAPSGDTVTVQGDAYDGSEQQLTERNEAISGQNLVARWTHQMADGTLQVQAYYDYNAHSIPRSAGDYLHTYDLDIQHSFSWTSWQEIVWGVGYRAEQDSFPTVLTNVQVAYFSPESRTLDLSDVFLQDSVSLSESLKLILGVKLEDDPYAGLEPLPSVRLSWKVTDSDLLWAAISRAVRAPSRLDRDLFETEGPILVLKGGDFQSEKLNAYELGYRAEPFARASLSISTFYNVYQDLRSYAASPGGTLPIMFANDLEGDTYGVELWGNYRPTDWWRLTAGLNWLHENLRYKPGALELDGAVLTGDDPKYQFSLRSSWDIARDLAFDIDLRGVGDLPNPSVPAYVELGTRIGWHVTDTLEISLSGANLLHPHHIEFVNSTPSIEIGRSFFLHTRWSF